MAREKMTKLQSLELQKRVFHFFENVANKNSKMTWNHFKKEGLPRRTIYNYITKFKDYNGVGYISPPGPRAKIATKKKDRSNENFVSKRPIIKSCYCS